MDFLIYANQERVTKLLLAVIPVTVLIYFFTYQFSKWFFNELIKQKFSFGQFFQILLMIGLILTSIVLTLVIAIYLYRSFRPTPLLTLKNDQLIWQDIFYKKEITFESIKNAQIKTENISTSSEGYYPTYANFLKINYSQNGKNKVYDIPMINLSVKLEDLTAALTTRGILVTVNQNSIDEAKNEKWPHQNFGN